MNESGTPLKKFSVSWKPVMLVIILTAGLLCGGYYFFLYQRNFIVQIHKESLSAVSTFKAYEIRNWINERKAEGVFLSSNPEFMSLFNSLESHPGNAEIQDFVREWLQPLKKNHEYSSVFLLNHQLKLLLSLGDSGILNTARTLERQSDGNLLPGSVRITEFIRDANDRLMLLMTAVLGKAASVTGYAVFVIDPSANLFPILASRPLHWNTAENILVHRDSSSLYYISGSQLKPDTVLAFKTPSRLDEITGKIPLQGTMMLNEVKDHRGKPVTGEIRHIEGTHWWLICKIDSDELLSPIYKRTLNIIVFILIFLIVIVILGVLVWKSQQASYYRARFELQKKSEIDSEQIRYMNALLQEISDAIITFDKDMIIQSWNKGAERIYGWKAEEVVGKFGGGSLRVDFPGASRYSIFEELEQKGSWKGELIHKRKDGSTAYVLSSTSQLKDENGKVLGLITINKDISDVIQSEKVKGAVYRISELAHSARDLNDLFGSIHIVIGDLIDARNIFIALLEPDDETISVPYFIDEKEKPPQKRKRGNTLTDIVLRTGKHLLAKPEDVQYFIERGIIDMQGTLAIDWLGVPLKIESETIGALVIQSYSPKIRYSEREVDVLTFVSEQIALSIHRMKIQQELIIAKQKAEVSSKLTSSLLANMNHELRTPMNGILGFAEILSNEMLDPESKAKADNILISGRRLMDTLDAIMDLSHLESNTIERKFTPLTIKKAVMTAISHYEPVIQRKNLSLNINVPAFIRIMGDDYLFQHLVRCLIDNAVKYTEKGSITIETREAQEDEKETVHFIVKDTGIGISEENYELIFETFRQVSEGYGRKFEGSGLGLTISRKIARLLGGDIHVKSKLGEGSEFTVVLPALGAEPVFREETISVSPGPEANAETAVFKEQPAILIVEDNMVNLQLLTLYTSEFCNAYSALDAKTAIECAITRHFDLVLMDINLGPGVDGIQTMLEIRKRPEYKNVPFVALTGYASIGDRDRLMTLGFNGYLPKPVSREALLGMIGNLVKKSPGL